MKNLYKTQKSRKFSTETNVIGAFVNLKFALVLLFYLLSYCDNTKIPNT